MRGTIEETDLIGAIYDAVIYPQQWDYAVDLIRRSLGFYNAMIGVHDSDGMPVVQAHSGVPRAYAESIVHYGAEISEIWGGHAGVARFPEEEPVHMAQVISPARWQNNRFYLEWCRPQGLVDQMVLILERTPRLLGTLGLGVHESQPPIHEMQIAAARRIAPHLRRATIISGLLTSRAQAARSFEDTLTALGSAVVLVNADLGIVYANAHAENMMREGDPVTKVSGRLAIPREVVEGQLRQAIAAASEAGQSLARGSGIPVRRADGSGMIIHVLPLGQSGRGPAHRSGVETDSHAGSLSPSRAVAAVFIAKPDAELDLPLEALSALYQLRPAETRVFDLIAKGLSGPAIAAALGVAPSTVKTHTLRLLDKLGVRTRADILRVARDACLGPVRDSQMS